MLLGGQTTEFHMNVILTIASYSTGVGFSLQFAYRPKAAPFAGEACARLIVPYKNAKSLEERLAEQLCRTVRSHLVSFNVVPMCFGALRGRPPSKNANWQRQARHE